MECRRDPQHAFKESRNPKIFRSFFGLKIIPNGRSWKKRSRQQIEPVISPRGREDFKSRYILGGILGSGSFGVVKSCVDRETGESFACKVFQKSLFRLPDEDNKIQHEINVMERVQSHGNVVRFCGAYEDQNSVYLVLENCKGGDLYAFLASRGGKGLEENLAARLFSQVLNGVMHCHNKGVVHRDLKLENVLLSDEGNEETSFAKIADFGAAVFLHSGETAGGDSGSLLYQAPEQVTGRKSGHAADVWSLGVILYALLIGGLPFVESTKARFVKRVKRGDFMKNLDAWEVLSDDAKVLVQKLLTPDPRKRPSLKTIRNDPWLLSHT